MVIDAALQGVVGVISGGEIYPGSSVWQLAGGETYRFVPVGVQYPIGGVPHETRS